MDRKDTEANLQMGRTEEREATIQMERRAEKAGTSKGSTTSSEGGEIEESVKRWRREQWINNP